MVSVPLSRGLLLFTKPAVPGRVKTRLIGELTPAQAAELQAAFLADLTRRLSGGSFELVLAWALEHGEEVPPGPPAGIRQEGGDLGDRLYRGLSWLAQRHELVAAVGSDHPDLPLARVEEAFWRLEGEFEAVLGPAVDGGFYLVALQRSVLRPALFERIEWSTDRVLEQTRRRLREENVALFLLPPGADVDTPQDLESLAWRLTAGRSDVCAETRALLDSWGRAPSPAEHNRGST